MVALGHIHDIYIVHLNDVGELEFAKRAIVEPDFQNTVPDLYERAQENGSMEM